MDNMEIEQKIIDLEKRIKNIEFEQLDSAGEYQRLAEEIIQIREKNSKLLESKYKSNDFLMKENEKYAHVADDRYIDVIEKLNSIEAEIKEIKKKFK